MDKNTLLEDRTHGDTMFPLKIYTVDYLDGDVIFNWHWHPEVEFILMEEGEAVFRLGTSTITLKKGEALFVPSGELHAGYPSNQNQFTFHAIVFNISLVSSHMYDTIQSKYIDPIKSFNSISPLIITCDDPQGKNMINKLTTIKDHYFNKDETFELLIKGQLFLLLAEILVFHPLQPTYEKGDITDLAKLNRLKLVLQYIDAHYYEKLNIHELASLIQMSEGHFSRFFKSLVKMTPVEYINTVRVDRAAKLLKETQKKIIDISMEVGFDHPSYFIKTFRRQKKCTPSQFRQDI